MNDKNIDKKYITLIILIAAVFALVYALSRLNTGKEISNENPNKIGNTRKAEYAELYGKDAEIFFNTQYNLDKMTKEEAADFRKEKVKQYSFLNIYPLNYEPLESPHGNIYNSITDGADWTHHCAFYVANPYYLIGVAAAGTISDFGLRANDFPRVKYGGGKIHVVYSGINAKKWLYCAFKGDGPYEKGLVGLIGVNALDSGFSWGYVDKSRCKNISSDWEPSPSNIINAPHKFVGFYHVGQYNKNNLSPYDADAALKLEADTSTQLVIKLWRQKPKYDFEKEDLTYIISVIP